MVVSGANLDFCSTIVGWALPGITLPSRLDFHYMRNTFSPRAFVRPLPVVPVIRHIYPVMLHTDNKASPNAAHLHNNRSSHAEKWP